MAYLKHDRAGRQEKLVNRTSAGAVVTYFLFQRNPNGAPARIVHEDGSFTYYQYDALGDSPAEAGATPQCCSVRFPHRVQHVACEQPAPRRRARS